MVAPPSGGRVREGLVSQIASRFQQQQQQQQQIHHHLHQKPIHALVSPIAAQTPLSSSKENLNSANASATATSPTRNLSRSDSHQARFHSARAMFEKMGSADDLDNVGAAAPSPPASVTSSTSWSSSSTLAHQSTQPLPQPPPQSSSGLVRSRFNFPGGNSRAFGGGGGDSGGSSNSERSRSTSPFYGGSMSKSSSQSSPRPPPPPPPTVQNVIGNVGTSDQTSLVTRSTSSSNLNNKNCGLNGGDLAGQGAKMSKSFSNESNLNDVEQALSSSPTTAAAATAKVSLTLRPNIKELTNKQRNWFSNFERGKTLPQQTSPAETTTQEGEDHGHGEGVVVVNPAESRLHDVLEDRHVTASDNHQQFRDVGTNLNLPGDRRPLSALVSSSDCIEEFMKKNWKNGSRDESSLSSPPIVLESSPPEPSLSPLSSSAVLTNSERFVLLISIKG